MRFRIGFIAGLVTRSASLLRRREGTTTVELAIVLPVFLAMLSSIISFGSVLYIHNNMINAAREAVRRLAVGDLTTTQAVTYADNYLASWGLTFTITANDSNPSDPNDGDVTVAISVPAADAALMDFPGFFGTGTLLASVTMRKE